MKVIPKAPAFDPGAFDPVILSDPELKSRIQEFNWRYLHWTELKYRVETEAELAQVWNALKFTRELSSVKLDLCGKACSFCMIPQFTEMLHSIDRDAAGRIETRLKGERDAKRYLANSLIEEAIASSQMEGASTTRRVAKQMLMSRRSPRTPDELMIQNNYMAMQAVKGLADSDLTPEAIRELHRTIVSGTIRDGEEWEGRFRDTDDIVVGDPTDEEKVYHRPPTHDRVPELIRQLCEFANDSTGPYIHPIVKAIILHYMIGYIHPFVDGNGRLARSLFYWYSIRNGYWLFEYTSISSEIKKSQARYSYAYQFTESDGDDLTYFIRFNLECICRAVDSLTGYMDRKAAEQASALAMLTDDPDLNHIEASILRDMVLSGAPFSIYEVQSRYGVVYQTARKYVQHLEGLGYVRAAGKVGKRQLYVVECTPPDRQRDPRGIGNH